MVRFSEKWFAIYAESWDASSSEDTIEVYLETGQRFRAASKKIKET